MLWETNFHLLFPWYSHVNPAASFIAVIYPDISVFSLDNQVKENLRSAYGTSQVWQATIKKTFLRFGMQI